MKNIFQNSNLYIKYIKLINMKWIENKTQIPVYVYQSSTDGKKYITQNIEINPNKVLY